MEPINDVAAPVRPSAYGYALSFVSKAGLFGPRAVRAVLAGLHQMAFSGRCEYYTWESPRGDDYVVSLALKNHTGDPEPTYEWWKRFVKAVAAACDSADEVKLDVHSSELASVEGIRSNCLPCGAAEFVDGLPRSTLGEPDSWFLAECTDIIDQHLSRKPVTSTAE